MAQLGYTWYPQDWWTSQTFKRLKRYPLVRYAIRELFDLMYKEGRPVEMNREYLEDDFGVNLSDEEFEKLMEYITVDGEGKWWISSIKKRLSKAEAARENGKKGGRPRSKKDEDSQTQKPTEITHGNNPRNPPLEREKEIESKKESEESSHARTHEVFPDFQEPEQTKREWHMYPVDDLSGVLTDSVSWKESVCMQHRLKLEEVDSWITRFIGHLKSSGEQTKTLRDGRKHFDSWLRIQLNQSKSGKNGQPTQSDNAWRFDRNVRPAFDGDWHWIDKSSRWVNRDAMSNTERRRVGLL